MRRPLWISTVITLALFSLVLLFSTLAIPSAIARPRGPSRHSGTDSLQPEESLELTVNYGHNWVEGSTSPGATVALTVTDGSDVVKNSAVVAADPSGSFFVTCQDWVDGSCPEIEPGGLVEGTVPGATAIVGPLGTIMAELDEVRDLVTGTIHVPGLSGLLDVRCDIWVENGPGGILTTAEADGGSFTCDFGADGWDLEAGQEVALTYFEPDGDGVINIFGFPWMRVQYGAGDWVGGNYEAGHTIWITVSDDAGLAKATATASTVAGAGWGGDGFQVDGDEWNGEQPDIVPGDRVDFRADDGYTHSVDVGSVNGNLDIAGDRITGTVVAPGLTGTLRVECHAWGAPYPVEGRSDEAEADGSSSYTCDWSGEWDIEPGQLVAVMYVEPDEDRVLNTFEEPAPYLRLYKETQGEAGEGGNLGFRLDVANDGEAGAENVVISDTLLGMSYLTDTAPYPAQVTEMMGGEEVRWEVGTLPAGQKISFDLYVRVTDPATSNITSTALITTSTPYNQSGREEREHTWQGHVGLGDVEVNVGKWAWTSDPAPDTDFIFAINPCNNGSTSSSRVMITDTLHPSMTVQSWWSWTPGWQEGHRTSSDLVLSHPTLPNFACTEVYVRVYLDAAAWEGMPISNTAVIWTAQDGDPGNNEATWWGNVGEPYTNVWIEKRWGHGKLLPGGDLVYGISYGNDGNQPVTETIRLTDTVPLSTTFVEAWRDGPGGPEPVSPVVTTPEYVVWEIPGLENGFAGNFNVRVQAAPEAAPGQVLSNSVTLQQLPEETEIRDNQAVWIESVNPPGPNLRIHKEHEWQDDGRLHYEIAVGNVGDETIYRVTVTDTYPVSTTAGGWPGWDYWGAITVTDSAPTNQWFFELEALAAGEQARLWFDVDLDPAVVGEPLNWFTNTVEIMIPDGDVSPADNGYTDVAFSGGEIRWIDVGVYDGHLWGQAPQGPVTVTTAYGEAVLPADFDWFFPNDFLPGDMLTVTAGAGKRPVIIAIPTPFSAAADAEGDLVWGQVDHLDHEWLDIDIHGGATRQVQTDGTGHYVASFDDVPRGSSGEIRYQTAIDFADVMFHRYFRTEDLLLRVYQGPALVEADFPAGHTVWITVTDSGEAVKGTATVESVAGGGWGSDGFSTDWQQWQPEQPQISAGDRVYARADNGKSAVVHVGKLSGTVDATADTINGTVEDPLIVPAQMLHVECHPWGAPSENPYPGNRQSEAPSDGSAPYTCAWDPKREWDILPGQEIGVQYFEPDNDSVLGVFKEPAPYLRLEQGADGQPGAGGNLPFYIDYGNDGEADAENVAITVTLQGMGYLLDTSPFAVTTQTVPGGEMVRLDVGAVPAGSQAGFSLYTRVMSPAGTTISSTAVIKTGNPYDQGEPWEKAASWQGQVSANDTHLTVGKWSWTEDPAPDSEFVYQIDACNNGSTASAYAIITDTLSSLLEPAGWWADEPGWLELSRDTQRLVLANPSIPDFRCSSVYVKAYLTETASVGATISNTVIISTATDLERNDNEAYWEGMVNAPYSNLQADKWWDSGELVPGGRLFYGLEARNTGNRPITEKIRLTDTLPVSTSFSASWYDDAWGNRHPVTPTVVTGNQVVWEIDGLSNGYGVQFMVELALDQGATPGTVLSNRLVVGAPVTEAVYEDNVAVVVAEVYPAGPNLRVQKEGGWQDEGEQTHQAWYRLRVENVGDAAVYAPTITDTYPAGMALNGEVGVEWERWWAWGEDTNQQMVTVTLDALHPGETAWIHLTTAVPGGGPLDAGLTYTNTAEVTAVGADTNPADNADQKVLTTGPDLYVEKELVAGERLPGEVVTFSLRFGNDREEHEWWWNMQGTARLTETLPAGMAYVTSTLRHCERSEGCPSPPNHSDGNRLVWDLWPLAAGEWNEMYLTVRLADAISSSLVLTNRVEIASSEPLSDVEGIYSNNQAALPVMVVNPPYFDAITVQNDSDLALSWTADPAFATNGYEVWDSAQPYFWPGEPQASLLVSGPATEATDAGSIGDGQNRYYMLVGVDDEGLRYWRGSAGAFEFPLVPGGN